MIVRDNEKACNRSYACLLFRLPPSDLHVQQAQNSPRLMSVNLLTACPHRMNDWRYSHKREQEHKSSISKKYRTETLGLKIEVYHLVLSLYRGKAIQRMAQSLAFHSCVMSVSYLLYF